MEAQKTNRRKPVWDKRIDFVKTRELAATRIFEERKLALSDENGQEIDPFARIRLGHYETYLIQLLASSRASEAVDAYTQWVESGARVLQVRVRKKQPSCVCGHIKTSQRPDRGHEVVSEGVRGRCKRPDCATACEKYRPDPSKTEMRIVGIPDECLDSDRPMLLKDLATRTVNAYKHFSEDHLYNTHSGRYSTISYETDRGTPTAIIAQITHQTEAQVATYQNKLKAEAIIMERMKAPKREGAPTGS